MRIRFAFPVNEQMTIVSQQMTIVSPEIPQLAVVAAGWGSVTGPGREFEEQEPPPKGGRMDDLIGGFLLFWLAAMAVWNAPRSR